MWKHRNADEFFGSQRDSSFFNVQCDVRAELGCGKLPNGTISMSRLAVERNPVKHGNADEFSGPKRDSQFQWFVEPKFWEDNLHFTALSAFIIHLG